MKSQSLRRFLLPGLTIAALALSGCGAGNDTGTDAGSGTDGGSSGGSLSGNLNGGGSSAQTTAQQAWTAGFQSANPGVTVNYDPVGSGTGRTNFLSGATSFAGTDSALSDDDSEGDSEITQAEARCNGDYVEVPAYISPIAVVFNLSGVTDLNLSSEVIGKIFNGEITTWDDPEIAALNDGVDLPGTTITPVHRSDDSGTTSNFTDYLADTAGDAWPYPADDTWPIQSGESAEGTSGVVAAVQAGDGTIGYADESQAGGLSIAAIQVGDDFNTPNAEGAAQVVADSPRVDDRADTDLAIDIDRTITDSGAYPLLLTSYLVGCTSYDDANTAALVKGYLSYAVSDEGQQAAAEQAGSAPLDSGLAGDAQGAIDQIQTS